MCILREIEHLVCSILKDLVMAVSPKIVFPTMGKIAYKNKLSKQRFAVFLYVISSIHKNLVYGVKCTKRELYYNNISLTHSQRSVDDVVRNLCNIFRKPNWELGILSSGKGLVAGALRFIMKNGDIIDCHSNTAPTLILTDFFNIETIETSAKFALLIEKESVFKKLITDRAFLKFANEIIVVTGKGFPDVCTRSLIHRLYFECLLPVYAIVDADPFGVEILLVYQHGSRAMAQCATQLSCPQITWIGIHPSEVGVMNVQTEALGERDNKKIQELLKRDYLPSGVRQELKIMQNLQRKAEIENIASLSLNFLLNDYIPKKLTRNLVL